LKLRLRKSGSKIADRFPDRVVDEDPASFNAAMELGGDEAGLTLKECRIVRPRRYEGVAIRCVYAELVDQHNRRYIGL
jgi:hypothetical protein